MRCEAAGALPARWRARADMQPGPLPPHAPLQPLQPLQPHPPHAHVQHQPHPPHPPHQPHPHLPHLHPQLHREPRMLTGHMGQASGGDMRLGMGVGVRMQHCAPPPMNVMPQRPCPPPMHRPPPPHHRVQHAQIPTQPTVQASQMLPTTSTSVPSGAVPGVLTTTSQQVPVASAGVTFPQKPTQTNVAEEDTLLTDPSILNENGTNLTNSKEKTPMCLVNELARFNKIQHQYRLTSEQGPAHRRRFTVALRLGGGDKELVEEYTAEAPRIRAAQHAVAAEALRSTSFPRPPPRPPRSLRNRRTNASDIIMPTVELNALAMKLGEPATYKIESQPPQLMPMRNGSTFSLPPRPRIPPPITIPGQTNTMHMQQFNRNVNGRFYNPNARFTCPYKYSNNIYGNGRENLDPNALFRVELTVGKHSFSGKGATLQAARHDAASRALQELRPDDKDDTCNENDSPLQDNENENKTSCDIKSPVSMVHELALKFELPASFSVKSEKGPPHMKIFTTTCNVGEFVTEGEGNSKKISKKRAAEKMLDMLKKLPSYKNTVNLPKVQKPKRKSQLPKKKTHNLIKEKGELPNTSEQNPVSRLLQWANNRTGGGGCEAPQYNLMEETHGHWRRNFVIQCEVAGRQTTGSGTNKKVAKRNSAENMLIELGLGKTPTPPPQIKETEKQADVTKSPRKVTFSLDKALNSEAIISTGRQLVPGVLLMQDNLASIGGLFKTPTKNGVNVQTTATIAKEFLRAGTSPTADALLKKDKHIGVSSNSKPISSSVVSSTTGGNIGSSQTSQVIRPKDQLLYLAQLLGFQVQFSDFPKGNHGEFLSLVTLSTEPPMVCHGGGLTTDQSHDQSARAALESLSQMGLDNVTPVTNNHSGDGIRTLNSNSGSITGILTNGITNK